MILFFPLSSHRLIASSYSHKIPPREKDTKKKTDTNINHRKVKGQFCKVMTGDGN